MIVELEVVEGGGAHLLVLVQRVVAATEREDDGGNEGARDAAAYRNSSHRRYHVERTRVRERDDSGEEGRMLLRRIYKYMKALPNYRLGTPGLYHYTSVT